MYTEYNSQKFSDENNNNNFNNNFNNNNNFNDGNTYMHKLLGVIWKVLLVGVILVVLFLGLIQFGVITLDSGISPNAVILNQNEIGIKKGSGYQLISTVLPENATNRQVTWISSDPKVASVNEVTGYVKGIKDGTAIITVKTLINEYESECVVTVGNKNILATGLTVNEKYINLAVGYSQTLSYKLTPSNATENNLKFLSSDTSVATVNNKGVIKGIKEGRAIITVKSSNGMISDTSYVTVYKKGVTTVESGQPVTNNSYPTSIKLSETNINLAIGTKSQLIATVVPSSSNSSVSWSSSNSSVATVDSKGLVTAKSSGTATIVVKTVNGLTASATVKVGNYSLKLKNVKITTRYSVMNIHTTKQLLAVFEPSNATNKTVSWSSSNTNVATVDSSGNVKAVGAGSAIITVVAADGGYKDTVTIEVVNPNNSVEETGISFASSTYSIAINGTATLSPVITPSNATFKSVDFTSSDTSIATVDTNGVVKGIKAGTATITAITKRNKFKATVTVTVKKVEVTGVKLNTTNISINKGETYSLVADISPSNATNQNVTWTSSDKNIAAVDTNGIVTAKGSGTATITVTTKDGSKTATSIVKVN